MKNGVKIHYVMIPHDDQDKVFGDAFTGIIWSGQFSPANMATGFQWAEYSFAKAIKQESYWSIANQTWDFILGDEIGTLAAYALGMMHKKR